MDPVDAEARLRKLEAELERAERENRSTKKCLWAILAEFPLLFGYWLQLIDQEDVWEEALAACPSVDLWHAYLLKADIQDEVSIDAALKSVGLFFYSHPIWDLALDRAKNDDQRSKLLVQVLRVPLYEYAKYIKQARELLERRPEDEALREVVNQINLLQQAVAECWRFEEQLVTQYFDVKPIPEEVLQVWDQYLDYVEAQGDVDATRALYERCLVVTALYPGFWLRYARWESLNVDQTKTDKIFCRALAYKPKIAHSIELLRRRYAKAAMEDVEVNYANYTTVSSLEKEYKSGELNLDKMDEDYCNNRLGPLAEPYLALMKRYDLKRFFKLDSHGANNSGFGG